ncbi:MAG: HAD family hydrolase [Planctomycetota bacterium]|nr:HAD family hydrolase [Planctomycetota bacterium]
MTGKPNRAVFLDRDGVIIEDIGYCSAVDDVHILEGVPEASRKLRKAGFRLLVATNQSGIARGRLTVEGFFDITEHIAAQLAKQDAYLDAVYFCPHHEEHGEPPFGTECKCRKPHPGMLKRGISEWSLEHRECWMVGDSPSDVQAALNAHVKPLAIGFEHDDAPSFGSLAEAANHILERVE